MKSFTEAETTHITQVDDTEKDVFTTLYQHLEKGIQSMKKGDVFTIDEAWKEIDCI